MVILLPLYLLKMRRQIENAKKQKNNKDVIRQNAAALKSLINEGILKVIDDNEKAGSIDRYDSYVLAGLADKLYDYLYGDIAEFDEEGVKSMLADRLLVRYEDKLEEAIKKAKKEAKEEAKEEAEKKAKQEAEKKVKEETEKKTLRIARLFLAKGISAEDVAEATELPFETVKNLQLHNISAG